MRGELVIIIPFSLIGGAMAALNTYRELQRHMDRRRATRLALRTGVETFVVLAVMGVIAAWTMPWVVRNGR